MTREEANNIASAGNKGDFVAHDIVTVLERLGLLKLDQPKTATDKALDAINRHIMSSGGKTFRDGAELFAAMNAVGVRIVDQ